MNRPWNTPPVSANQPFPSAPSAVDLKRNLEVVRSRVAQACNRAGRSENEVRLLAVSKTVDLKRIRALYELGQREFGENKAQEGHFKWAETHGLSGIRWSMIGHLQTNKAKEVAQFASEFQALDNLRVAKALERRLIAENRVLDVMVQVNTSGESSKYGLHPEDVPFFFREMKAFSTLRVTGLMTLARLSPDEQVVRTCFRHLCQLRQSVQDQLPNVKAPLDLSMGMSGDFEIAIEEGATVVRVGQAIFGERGVPDSRYWPKAGQDS
ncbi:YggS family pyridoxal phosphate enzyme [Paraburkholderia strydomiana]|nr:YggS family pyridoxal phosphate enzyme [Paraburkholderia strydomiana]